jgi:hypothetical protein
LSLINSFALISDEATEVKEYVFYLEKLIRNPKRAREMGRMGRERILHYFTLDKMCSTVEEISLFFVLFFDNL